MVVDIHTHTFPERIAASTIQKLQDISHTRPLPMGQKRACGPPWSPLE